MYVCVQLFLHHIYIYIYINSYITYSHYSIYISLQFIFSELICSPNSIHTYSKSEKRVRISLFPEINRQQHVFLLQLLHDEEVDPVHSCGYDHIGHFGCLSSIWNSLQAYIPGWASAAQASTKPSSEDIKS